MSRRFILAGLAGLGLTVGGASVATAGSGGDSGGSSTVVEVKAKHLGTTILDLGEKGTNPGDRIIFSDALYKGDTKVGEDGAECVITRLLDEKASTAMVQCTATAMLPDGQITVQVLDSESLTSSSNKPITAAITGGTGRYRNASGELTIQPIDDETDFYTFRINL
jgi:hypothetical protein